MSSFTNMYLIPILMDFFLCINLEINYNFLTVDYHYEEKGNAFFFV